MQNGACVNEAGLMSDEIACGVCAEPAGCKATVSPAFSLMPCSQCIGTTEQPRTLQHSDLLVLIDACTPLQLRHLCCEARDPNMIRRLKLKEASRGAANTTALKVSGVAAGLCAAARAFSTACSTSDPN